MTLKVLFGPFSVYLKFKTKRIYNIYVILFNFSRKANVYILPMCSYSKNSEQNKSSIRTFRSITILFIIIFFIFFLNWVWIFACLNEPEYKKPVEKDIIN